ncbi:MAG TPA: FAD-linked oxidase C-terminal domain-containing protein [Kofleriaceae bacterium]|jgi:glycolate oxidase|nr:FAD-linked oxidase C-terminal domain-containing protein [Kofleriaceae bacterium]
MGIAVDLATRVKDIVGREAYLDSPADTLSYGFNSYPLYTQPAAVILFQSRAQVEQVLPLLYARDVPMVIRGSGTNVSGNALAPPGGVVLSLERMTKILEVDPISRYARVEAGANVRSIQDLAGQHGLFFPPNPGNMDAVTVGGIIGCNSSGDLALGYGGTRDFVLGMDVVTGDGQVLKLGSKVRKDVTGYDMVRLLVGSEGTLGVVVEATLRLIEPPGSDASVIATFDDGLRGAEVALEILSRRLGPVALEYMDERTTRTVEDTFQLGLPPGSRSTLIARFHGPPGAADAAAERCRSVFLEHRALWAEARSGDAAQKLWRARHLAYPALARICPTLFGEDIVVPLRHFPAAVRRMHELGKAAEVDIAVFAHAGDGHLHPLLLTDDADPEQRARGDRFVEEVILYALSVGGTITGEHGLGVHKTRYVGHQYGDAERDAMRRIKLALDPKGLFNPMIFPVTGHEPKNPRRRGVEIL